MNGWQQSEQTLQVLFPVFWHSQFDADPQAASQWVLFVSVPPGFGKQTAFVMSHRYFTVGGGGGGGGGAGQLGLQVAHVLENPIQSPPLQVTPWSAEHLPLLVQYEHQVENRPPDCWWMQPLQLWSSVQPSAAAPATSMAIAKSSRPGAAATFLLS
jgi:hypothetical protein